MRSIIIAAAVLSAAVATGEDFRPPFDKSDYKGTVAVQVNPWFPLNKPPKHALGGPNVAYMRNLDWRKGMELCAEYGVNAFVPEINEPSAWSGVWRELLDTAPKCKSGMKVGMFFGFYSKTPDAAIASMKKILGKFRKDLKENPYVLRAGGHPVIGKWTALCQRWLIGLGFGKD